MKLTLDRMCIQSGRLCYSCDKKFKQNEAGQIDIDIGKILLEAEENHRFLKDITVTKIFETSTSVYVVAKRDDIPKLKDVEDEITEMLHEIDKNKKFHFVPDTKNKMKLISNILDPVEPVGNSTIMLPPEGKKELKVKIKSSDKSNLKIDTEELSEITSKILGMNAHYSYV